MSEKMKPNERCYSLISIKSSIAIGSQSSRGLLFHEQMSRFRGCELRAIHRPEADDYESIDHGWYFSSEWIDRVINVREVPK